MKSDEERGFLRRRGWRLLAALALLAVVAWLLAPLALSRIGHWLIVADELHAADAVFVHAGHSPFREIQGAEVYRQGLAPEVWIAPITPTPESRAFAEIGVDMPPERYWRQRVLVARGVPEEAIRTIPRTVLSTEDEIAGLVEQLQGRGLDSVILVTSKYHTRRVRAIWRQLAPEGLEAMVVPAARDPFDPDSWWTNTEDGQAVIHELFGLVNTWLGMGLTPERD